jgi:hypothetical protein
MALRLLTPLDLPAPYGKDASPLTASEFLTAAKAQLVFSAGSFEDNRKTGRRFPQGFAKTQFSVRALPRRLRSGTDVADAHFMDAVVCIGKNGEVVSQETLTWKSPVKWFGETDQYRDCIEVGPIFVEKGESTGFDKNVFPNNVDLPSYRKDGVRSVLWGHEHGVVNPVFYCSNVGSVPVFGMAEQIEETNAYRMGLGDLAKVISGPARTQNRLSCDRAIMLAHRAAGYFDTSESLGTDEGQAKTAMPSVFAVFLK